MQTKKPLNVALAIVLTTVLSGCGGGGSSSNSNSGSSHSDNQNQKTDNNNSSGKDNNNVSNDKAIASSILLANDTALPPPPENSKPITPLKDKATIEALKDGIYKFELVKVVPLGNIPKDCSEDDTCPAITKFKLNTENNKIEIRQWAYMPIAKKWIELSNVDTFIHFPEHNISIDGIVSFEKPSKINSDFLSFKYENPTSKMEISGKEKSIANINYKSTLTDEPATYSKDAKSYKFYGELVEGEIISLNSPNDSGEDLSNLTSYSTLAAFRDAHRDIASPFCFQGNYLVFNKTRLGATEYNGGDSCHISTITQPLQKSYSYNEYVKNGIIYLNHSINYSVKETSSHQYYWAIDIDGAGYGSSGKALQKGYSFVDDETFYNESAVVDWLATKYPEFKESGLPDF